MPDFVNLNAAIIGTKFALLDLGRPVNTGHWQGVDVSNKPEMESWELMNWTFSAPIISPGHTPHDVVLYLQNQIQPNLPWAEDHFQERVSGEALNPGEQYKNWPYWHGQDKTMKEGEVFTHTYMERYWPQSGVAKQWGIRYPYGDLDDLVELLRRHPYTRQAYLPIFFPEDTGAVHGGRIPCTLGYHFMLRDGKLHIFYPIRSCDFIRHFRDDVYLTCRLLLWVLNKLKLDEDWSLVSPGNLYMHIYSLHLFKGDEPSLWENQ